MEEVALSPFWGKLKAISALIASVSVPLVIGVVSIDYNNAVNERDSAYNVAATKRDSAYNEAASKREMNVRYVEMAIEILAQEPSDDTKALRDWAIHVIQRHSEVELSPEAISVLGTHGVVQ